MTEKKVALITGASAGIGKATTLSLLEKGWCVYAVARRTDKLKELEPHGAHTLFLDVTDEASMKTTVDTILKKEGRLDALVNNAGYGEYGAIEDVPMDKARHQFEVNIFGLARLTQLVLPTMRKQGTGRIVNISSMGGKACFPLGGWYHATKFALEALSDALRHEVKPFGIDVTIVQPGAIKTEWDTIARDSLAAASNTGTYAPLAKTVAQMMETMYNVMKPGQPECIARVITHALTTRKPKIRYVVPLDAKIVTFTKWLLPDCVWDGFLSTFSKMI